jgi:hypothetical protein
MNKLRKNRNHLITQSHKDILSIQIFVLPLRQRAHPASRQNSALRVGVLFTPL